MIDSGLPVNIVIFLFAASIIGYFGVQMTKVVRQLAHDTGMGEAVMGAVFIGGSISLSGITAALTLAVGDIIDGNTFDTLFISVSDIAYRQGSIYRDITNNEIFWLAMTILMTGVLLMGLLHRQRHGIANIGWESFLVILLYGSGLGVLLN